MEIENCYSHLVANPMPASEDCLSREKALVFLRWKGLELDKEDNETLCQELSKVLREYGEGLAWRLGTNGRSILPLTTPLKVGNELTILVESAQTLRSDTRFTDQDSLCLALFNSN